jgi:GT2 family glycosyltransferase
VALSAWSIIEDAILKVRYAEKTLMIQRFSQWYQVFRKVGTIEALNMLGVRLTYRPRHAGQDSEYTYEMFSRRLQVTSLQKKIQEWRSKFWRSAPRIAIITIADTVDGLLQTQESITSQTYPYFQWYVCIPPSVPHAIKDQISARCIPLETPSKADCLNTAVDFVKEPFVMLVEAGDTLSVDALYRFADHLRRNLDADVVYADVDYVSKSTGRRTPFFKPEWSPEMLLSVSYPQYPMLFRKALLVTCGTFDRTMDTACEWDFLLRVSEHTRKFQRIAHVLYHYRGTFPYAISQPDRVQQLLEQHLSRLNLAEPRVSFQGAHDELAMVPVCEWKMQEENLVSIIIPSKDKAPLLSQCLSGIFGNTNYPNLEVVVVDTGSMEAETHLLYEHFAHHGNFRVVRYTEKFNFSRACNHGVAYARGELLLFLNNDTEILHADWLTGMVQWFDNPDVGIVGCKLLYPSGAIQHAGIIVGIHGLADNFLSGKEDGAFTFVGSDQWYRDRLAVTGACLMISKQAYEQVNGFNEHYLLNFSDVQLCLDVGQAGYRVVYTPFVRVRHHESMTHKKRMPRADVALGLKNMQAILLKGDPYYSPNLSYRTPVPVLSRDMQDSVQFRNRILKSSLYLWFDD